MLFKHQHYSERVDENGVGRHDHLFMPLRLPWRCRLLEVCAFMCQRVQGREGDSAEHGGYERRRQQEKYERGLVNSCALLVCLYVRALVCLQSQNTHSHY